MKGKPWEGRLQTDKNKIIEHLTRGDSDTTQSKLRYHDRNKLHATADFLIMESLNPNTQKSSLSLVDNMLIEEQNQSGHMARIFFIPRYCSTLYF